MNRILVPCDFSATCACAVEAAADLSRRYRIELVLLHVITPDPIVPAYPSAPEPSDAEQVIAATAALELAAGRARDAGATSVRTRIAHGVAATEILAAIRDEGVSLVVMGTHGRTGLDLLLVGSVATKVVRKSPCPVLTIPPTSVAGSPPSPA